MKIYKRNISIRPKLSDVDLVLKNLIIDENSEYLGSKIAQNLYAGNNNMLSDACAPN